MRDPQYQSCAEWPDDLFTAADGTHISTDTHDTEEQAQGVCRMLAKHGFGGFGRKPLRVWVEKIP
jgi:hypothetical protein